MKVGFVFCDNDFIVFDEDTVVASDLLGGFLWLTPKENFLKIIIISILQLAIDVQIKKMVQTENNANIS